MTQAALSRSRAHETGSGEIIRRLTEMFPAQDGAATRIALALYGQLARQDRVSVEGIAAAAGISGDHVAAQLAAWPAVYRDDEGAVIGFRGPLGASDAPPLHGRRARAVHLACLGCAVHSGVDRRDGGGAIDHAR